MVAPNHYYTIGGLVDLVTSEMEKTEEAKGDNLKVTRSGDKIQVDDAICWPPPQINR